MIEHHMVVASRCGHIEKQCRCASPEKTNYLYLYLRKKAALAAARSVEIREAW